MCQHGHGPIGAMGHTPRGIVSEISIEHGMQENDSQAAGGSRCMSRWRCGSHAVAVRWPVGIVAQPGPGILCSVQ
jgi:hypothetical protein